MIEAPAHPRESLRLTVMRNSGLLSRKRERIYDDFVTIASALAQAPIALISLVDQDQQWFKARSGLDVQETPRKVSFCAHAIVGTENALLVEDALRDKRFFDNPLVTGDPHIRFYYGVVLRAGEEQLPVGTICVIDRKPRVLANDQVLGLIALGRIIEQQFVS